ncbi:unnamed protein product [Adineta steineri]|uniref:Zinc-binding loop region of homing endonuclease domain-containing protein n=1 Tax=Adineta steineri TaxID=433720 RepID=A0A818R1K7_9BILA|nr:unnamed protein product [Adineta steineri]CAF3974692.1 unnamed protein product [Adineta steineri]
MARTNNPQEFLNSLELGQSLSITMEQLVTMKNARGEQHPDGAFLKRWIECKIREKFVNQEQDNHPHIIIHRHGITWPLKVRERFEDFCVSKNEKKIKKINFLNIYCHHIILRLIVGRSGRQLPLLAAKKNHEEASHLCDTTGCLREEHLCIEKREINRSRIGCGGIVLTIFRNIAGECCIFQVNPCEHGIQHPDANGDYLRYSCRKIQVVCREQRKSV